MTTVRGLPVPAGLRRLQVSGRWRHPGAARMRRALPWFEAELVLLPDTDRMAESSRLLDVFAGDPASSALFHIGRGSQAAPDLPWLDAGQACLIAVSREPGEDVAVALDYRGSRSEPRVVASDPWTDPRVYVWRLVAPSFAAFAGSLGLAAGR